MPSEMLTPDMQTDFTPINDPVAAWERVNELYEQATAHLRDRFKEFAQGKEISGRVRASYPKVRLRTESHARVDTRLAYGFVAGPGVWEATITRPGLFKNYLIEQFTLLLRNHHLPIEVGISETPIPVHFAFPDGLYVEGGLSAERLSRLRDVFDVPDLEVMDDSIVNGTYEPAIDRPVPLSLFTAARVDFSLFRLKHYTGTSCEHFQNFVLFTNYQFYIDEFVAYAHELMESGEGDYTAFVEPGDRITTSRQFHDGSDRSEPIARLPQMPAYHLKRPDASGITIVNIGVGPSNAKTATDHIAVLRPHAWVMLGHCAGLRTTQRLGDYVLAHGYVREDHVLDADLPTWVPVPALAEVQVALEEAVGEVTGLRDYELKSVMRTGTVATIDNRNWELRDYREPLQRFSQSRAIALDMESATIAANGFRFRVPYGTLLCVSDKPLHGEIKLPGMADAFYKKQVGQHLRIGILAVEKLRSLGLDRLHSRKLRSLAEAAVQ